MNVRSTNGISANRKRSISATERKAKMLVRLLAVMEKVTRKRATSELVHEMIVS